jgi:glucokinase
MQITAVGVDIGGTATKIALVDVGGNISNFTSINTVDALNKREKYLEDLYSNIYQVIANNSSNCVGIGVSMLGLQMEDGSGTLYSSNALGFKRFNIRSALQKKFNMPVTVTNDLTAHALAEYYFGIGKTYKRFLSVAMGTGVGCAMVLNGEPVILFGGTSGDCGRMIIDPNVKISCGMNVRGSAEALCGTNGIEYLAKKYYGENENLVARDVIIRAREGKDEIAIKVIKKIGFYLGHLLANLSVIFFPQIIAITGGTVEAGPVLIEASKERFNDLVGEFHRMFVEAGGTTVIDIKKAVLGSNAGIVGGTIPLLRPYLLEKG